MEPTSFRQKHRPAYRLDLLPVVPPFFRQARDRLISRGELVYYGPMPTFYGIGEVVRVEGLYVVVDFHGTGEFGVHEEILQKQYVLPIPDDRRDML